MGEFTLDTSGAVSIPHSADGCGGGNPRWGNYQWSNLDPFTQGYIEALFESQRPLIPLRGDSQNPFRAPRFSDLAPETLARIIEDCAEMARRSGMRADDSESLARKVGAKWWLDRQAGECREAAGYRGFPPLPVHLGNDGKVRFQSPSQPHGMGGEA